MVKETRKRKNENLSDGSQQVQPASLNGHPDSGKENNKDKPLSAPKKEVATKKQSKKRPSKTTGDSTVSRKMPKRSAAPSDFKEKSIRVSEKDLVIENKAHTIIVQEEIEAVHLTAGQEGDRPCRRLTEFTFHNENGVSQPFEMMEADDCFISGLILPLEENIADKEKSKGVKCEGFGRIEEWAISGYEEGSPVVWVSTELADYDCVKPSGSYKKFYDHFYAKASACVEVYKKLSKSSGGNPDLTLDELLAGVVRAMSGMKCFSGGLSVREFIVCQGEFIFTQLVGLDETSKSTDRPFLELQSLNSLRDECAKSAVQVQPGVGPLPRSLRIYGDEDKKGMPDGQDSKMAMVLQDNENWASRKQNRNRNLSSASSGKYYIKINEDEIANDYPPPTYYKPSVEETDEYILFDSGMDVVDIDALPESRLHNWVLYNSDARLVPLELLPLKPCSDIDMAIFGSGFMTAEDDSGYSVDGEYANSSSGVSENQEIDGIPIFLSEIKEWLIEFGFEVVSIKIRTDMSWYRLGKPAKQYTAWYDQVVKIARLAASVIAILKGSNRVAKISFADAIKAVSEFSKDHPAYISSDKALVERYMAVHGQIILHQFSVYPDYNIKKCPFVMTLTEKMEVRHHTKWLVTKKKHLQKNEVNLNPRAAMGPVVSKRKAMNATTTRLINRIWGGYYSNHLPEESIEVVKEDNEIEDQEENEEDDTVEDNLVIPGNSVTPSRSSGSKRTILFLGTKKVKWGGESVGKLPTGEALYKRAMVHEAEIVINGFVQIQVDESDEFPAIYFIEYMFEKSDGRKMFHGRMMERGCNTVLGNTANERELFMTNDCSDLQLEEIDQNVHVNIRSTPWGHQYRKANAEAEKIDRAQAEERKKKGLPTEYYCKSLYWPNKGAFCSLPYESMGLGSGVCLACKCNEDEIEKEKFELYDTKSGFIYQGKEYSIHDYVYISPYEFTTERECENFKGGRNVGLKAYVVCQLLEICGPKQTKKCQPNAVQVKVRRFFRPEDVSADKAYSSDIRELYYSEEMHTIPVDTIEGKCEIRRKKDLLPQDGPSTFDHAFFCEYLYDPAKGSIKQLPSNIKVRYSTGPLNDDAAYKKKGKCKEGELDEKLKEGSAGKCLASLDIFAGCGGLSEGLQQSGVVSTKWAIEYEEAAGDAFKLNHPEALVFVNNCNVILRALMEKCGDSDDCISTPEAAELAAKLDREQVDNLPMPGQVDFINGGPPCQGFSGMNRFNQSTWSKVQSEMILAFLSFADVYRPKYFLLENVRNFVSFNQGQTFRLTVASLLEMGYQVRFGILEAGAFGVPQSRKRAFIWAAAPEETLPEWPEPMHVFSAPELKVSLSGNSQYSAVKSTARGAPLRSLTVRDTIGDLPPVKNGASNATLEYQVEPVSWFQKKIRGNMDVLNDHISKEMNELNLIRCQRIPKRPGSDWRDLPEEKVKLSNGQVVDLIPWCLPNTAKRHNQWKGLFGRLDWEGNFPTSITDPQPMGKVGMCFHPEQDRIVTVRECARSQGFPDRYKFSGVILHKHRQIGNAVPPPLAYALGTKLKEAVESKKIRG